jgi:hypothetical protein
MEGKHQLVVSKYIGQLKKVLIGLVQVRVLLLFIDAGHCKDEAWKVGTS